MIIVVQTLMYFRETLLTALHRLLRPYYKKFSLSFSKLNRLSDDEDSDDQVFADFDDEKGVVFYPPVYAQRYAAVSDCLMDERWCGKLEKIVDLGYHDISYIKYLKDVPGVKHILGVDIEGLPLNCSYDLISGDDCVPKLENPLQITLFQGNAADPDFRLIGCDAVTAIEMIEHMLPHDLERLIHTVFGFIKPQIAVITTPNGDFNVLFKALEKNGLRRLDHFFEWSREQFYDWCSNIVARYPQYTVTCKGIGPGPPGTNHLGCCSQLALFINKEYRKQQDLGLNSLALIDDAPDPNNKFIKDMIVNDLQDDGSVCSINEQRSINDLLYSNKQSCLTIVVAPSFSLESLEYSDKTSQCNMETEIGKSFLMFDNEVSFKVLLPRRRVKNKVYDIEDVVSRLNCSTLHVTKFSKTTQNLMARNKIDSLVHTREVVDEIRHLTKMLNFEKNCISDGKEGSFIWNNINWGTNAPYWNQYYKVVKQYKYPLEVKSEEMRILDTITDEINRLVDTQYDGTFSVDVDRLEIPLDHLMRIVEHITDDKEKVKDLLEWNGYEITDNLVIHSRLVMDEESLGSQDEDWKENEFIDWDSTDHSTLYSDASTIVPDYHGRCLRRALDRKVRRLRSMLSADEDISTEIDKVVCRLMKLALRSSRGLSNAPTMQWLQCKLFDQLSLSEKAIERRKMRFIERYQLKADCYDNDQEKSRDIALEKIKEDNTAVKIMDKYHHLVEPGKDINNSIDIEFDDDLNSLDINDFFKEYEFTEDIKLAHPLDNEVLIQNKLYECMHKGKINETQQDRTKAWVEEDLSSTNMYPEDILAADTEPIVSEINNDHILKKYPAISYKTIEKNISISPKTSNKQNKLIQKHHKPKRDRQSSSKLNSGTNVVRKKSSCKFFKKYQNKVDYNKSARKLIEYKKSSISASRVKECESRTSKDNPLQTVSNNLNEEDDVELKKLENIATTKESVFIDIVMDDAQETIALRRTIATDTDIISAEEQEAIIESEINITTDDSNNKHHGSTENVLSQTVFLYDVNEPSTSKGVRHNNMDVQCGSELSMHFCPMTSATTSLTNMPNKLSESIKIVESFTGMSNKCSFGTSTKDDSDSMKIVYPRRKSMGIKIKDSEGKICGNAECSTMTAEQLNCEKSAATNESCSMDANETKLIKLISPEIKLESSTEICSTVSKSPLSFSLTHKNISQDNFEESESEKLSIARCLSLEKSASSKLRCGGFHIHSYKDRQQTEDVVYQGEWQQRKSKCSERKVANSHNSLKSIQAANKKHNMKEQVNETKYIKKDENKTEKTRTLLCAKYKQKEETLTKLQQRQQNIINSRLVKRIRSNKKLSGGNSKIKTNSTAAKNVILSTTINKLQTKELKKEIMNIQRSVKKTYLPPYLRKKVVKSLDARSDLNKSIDTVMKNNVKTHGIGKGILQFSNQTRINTNFSVFRNEIENKKSNSDRESPKNKQGNSGKEDVTKKRMSSPRLLFENQNRNDSMIRNTVASSSPKFTTPKNNSDMANKARTYSPISNSSECSSPNSIATIKMMSSQAKEICSRLDSTSTNKMNKNNMNVNASKIKNKKYTKKSQKSPAIYDNDNKNDKENKASINIETNNRSLVAGKKENICKTESTVSTRVVKNSDSTLKTTNKLNVIIGNIESDTEKKKSTQKETQKMPLQSKKESFLHENKENVNSKLSVVENILLQHTSQKIFEWSSPKQTDAKPIIENAVLIEGTSAEVLTELLDDSNDNKDDSHMSDIITDMKQLIEERLDLIDTNVNLRNDTDNFDSKTVILSRSTRNSSLYEECSSPASYKTIIDNDDVFNAMLDINLEDAFNHTFDTNSGDDSISLTDSIKQTLAEFDLLSYKSMISPHTSSNERIETIPEVFENEYMVQNMDGFTAQALSEFSVCSGNMIVDKPDDINFIDSETGSCAMGISRRIISEEIFVSGRSSESFVTCNVDEVAVVPSWLFHVMSQQESIDEEEPPEVFAMPMEMPMPFEEPDIFDINGNTMEPHISAGAGDGCGMHSDQSQDSSGQGTSISSTTDTSSGQPSEAVLIDPSTFTVGQYSLLHDSMGSIMVVAIPMRAANGSVQRETATGGSDEAQPIMQHSATSDGDADVSSLDTDLQDSDI